MHIPPRSALKHACRRGSGCTRSLGWWWALLGLTESSCGGGGAPARWRGRFRIFSVTAGAAPENSGMTMGRDSFTCSGEDGTRGLGSGLRAASGEPVKESPAGKTSLSKISSSFRTSFRDSGMKISGISAARRRIPPALRLRCREATAREGHCGGAVGFVLEVVAGGEVESCEGEVVAARDWHGACLPGSAFWK